MNIAIIGSGNIGSTLAKAFLQAGHTVMIGTRFPLSEKSIKLAAVIGEDRFNTVAAVAQQMDVIVLTTPAAQAIEAVKEMGNTQGKVIIDTMNTVGKPVEGFSNTADAILANTETKDVVKCFNTTGYENLASPVYNGTPIDMFVAGSSEKAKTVATQLALEMGFGKVYDFGGNDKFDLIEQFALCWINLAIVQKLGRGMAFKILQKV